MPAVSSPSGWHYRNLYPSNICSYGRVTVVLEVKRGARSTPNPFTFTLLMLTPATPLSHFTGGAVGVSIQREVGRGFARAAPSPPSPSHSLLGIACLMVKPFRRFPSGMGNTSEWGKGARPFPTPHSPHVSPQPSHVVKWLRWDDMRVRSEGGARAPHTFPRRSYPFPLNPPPLGKGCVWKV